MSSEIGARSSSESSMVSSTFGESTADFNDDTEYLIRSDHKPNSRLNNSLKICLKILIIIFCRVWEQLKRRSSYQALPSVEMKKIDVYRDLHHPVFQNIRVIQVIIRIN